MKKILFLLNILAISIALPLLSEAQITIVPSATAATLANKLVGPGVTLIGPTLTCTGTAEGTFSGISTLSFDSGIVLTNGTALTSGGTIGAGGPASSFASTGNGTPGDPMLTGLAGLPTYDACILEFNFRPAGDTVKFNYVFGSEEYTSFTCTSFNDVFGFFISGPGYAGPTNIAKVPGTNIPVCINSVNCGPTGGGTLSSCTSLGAGSPFCAYYVNNSTGTTITYDGLTTTLTAIAHVTPCDTYHLKIGVADASDDVFDSGVFLEAGSLSSTGIHITPVGINSSDTTTGSQYVVRGCIPGVFVFNTSAPSATGLTIHYIIAGTAVNGVDYTTIADSVVIPPGGTSNNVLIHGLPVTGSGVKTIKLLILAPYTCGGAATIIDSAIMNIYDSFYVHIVTPDTTICEGQSVHIITLGDTVLQYQWTPAATVSNDTVLSPVVTPLNTTTYTVSATYPGAGCAPTVSHITVNVIHPFTLDLGPSIKNTCVGVPLQLNVNVIPAGGGGYSYSWTPVAALNNPAIANPVVTPTFSGDQEYYVTVTVAPANCTATDSFKLHVLPNDFSLFNPDTGVCFSASIPVRAVGDVEFAYHWEPSTLVSNPNVLNPFVNVTSTTIFTVTGSYPNCPNMVHSFEVYVESPHTNILTGDTAFCIGQKIPIAAIITPVDSPVTFVWSPATNLIDPTLLSPTFYSNIVGDYTYTLTATTPLGCTSSDQVTMSPKPPALVHINASYSGGLNLGDRVQLNAENLTPYALEFWWTPNNGSLTNPNINNPVATMTDTSMTFEVFAINIWGCRDSASVTIKATDGDVDFVPTGFTPNGDGLNDIFKIPNLKGHKLVDFSIYNRWGQLVYHNNSGDGSQGWDGTFNGEKQDIGVYNYVIILSHPDGTNKVYKGDITLLK